MLKSLIYRPNHYLDSSGGFAWVGHTPFAHWLMKALRPKIFVELGTHYGGSYFSFCDGALQYQLETQCYAVDSWQGDDHAGHYDEKVWEYVSEKNETYANFSSLNRCQFTDAIELFEDASIDLLHIDGFHTYNAVSEDFHTWLPKLSGDAVVLFHDTQVFKADFGVHKFWSEIQNQNPKSCFEFHHSHGLGVLCLGGNDNIFERFAPAGINEGEFRALFEVAGVAVFDAFVPKKKVVSVNEVFALTKQLCDQSQEYREEIKKLVA